MKRRGEGEGMRQKKLKQKCKLRPKIKKIKKAEIPGRKFLRPKPLESVPQFFCPSPTIFPSPLQIKLSVNQLPKVIEMFTDRHLPNENDYVKRKLK